MCISDNTRRRSLLGSADAAVFLAEAVLDESAEPEYATHNYNPNNQRSYKRMTYSSIITKPTTVEMASALRVKEEVPEIPSSRQHCVQHNYHDHSADVEGMYQQKPAASKGGVSVPFPMKLHDLLEHIQSDEPELASIVSWQPHGRCFLVHKPKDFADHVLPRFFQQKKYASFQRQLNLYGFSRITRQGPDRGSYYHEYFLRGKKFLCRGINRMKVKGTGARMASNPDAEPDFYSMAPIVPTSLTSSSSSTRNMNEVVSSSNLESDASMALSSLRSRVNYLPELSGTSSFNSQQAQSTMNANLAPLQSAASYLPTSLPSSQPDHLTSDSDLVFGNMTFHSLDTDSEAAKFRRHSLMDPRSRRSSFVRNISSSSRRGSVKMDDMDSILRMFQSDDLTDEEMGQIMNDIIAL